MEETSVPPLLNLQVTWSIYLPLFELILYTYGMEEAQVHNYYKSDQILAVMFPSKERIENLINNSGIKYHVLHASYSLDLNYLSSFQYLFKKN